MGRRLNRLPLSLYTSSPCDSIITHSCAKCKPKLSDAEALSQRFKAAEDKNAVIRVQHRLRHQHRELAVSTHCDDIKLILAADIQIAHSLAVPLLRHAHFIDRSVTAELEEVSLKDLAATLIREFFPSVEHAVSEDLEALKEMMGQYSSIADFMLSFAIDREAFAQFIEKNYVECQVPVTDKFLTLSTIHSAKGLEWKNVIIMGLSEGNFPNMWFARDMDEEGKSAFLNDLLKSMFVAATRTSGNLFLTYSRQNAWGYSQMPSRFLRGAK